MCLDTPSTSYLGDRCAFLHIYITYICLPCLHFLLLYITCICLPLLHIHVYVVMSCAVQSCTRSCVKYMCQVYLYMCEVYVNIAHEQMYEQCSWLRFAYLQNSFCIFAELLLHICRTPSAYLQNSFCIFAEEDTYRVCYNCEQNQCYRTCCNLV